MQNAQLVVFQNCIFIYSFKSGNSYIAMCKRKGIEIFQVLLMRVKKRQTKQLYQETYAHKIQISKILQNCYQIVR